MSTDTVERESRRSGWLVDAMRWMENLSDTQYAYLLLTPIFILMGVVAIYPLLRTFELSLYAFSLQTNSLEFVGIDNYIELFTGEKDRLISGTFLPALPDTANFEGGVASKAYQNALLESLVASSLVVTIMFSVISVFFETIIGFGQALILDQDFAGRKWIRAAIIIPWAVPVVIQGMIFYLMFSSQVGFLTPPLADLGILVPNNTLNDPVSSLFVIIIADIWKTSAFMALLILAGLQSIDRGLYDVAKVAGATTVQQFRYITFPLILPTIGIAVLFRTVQAMRVYGIIDLVSSCTVVPSLSCMVVNTFNSYEGTSATIAFVTAFIIGVVVMLLIVWQGEDAI